jgi:FMN-binding domain
MLVAHIVMRRSEQRPALNEQWLDNLRNGYTDVPPVVLERHSSDAECVDGHWTHHSQPEPRMAQAWPETAPAQEAPRRHAPRHEALTAQSTNIAVVSGATYTSNAYKQSLRSAINAAKA